MTVITILGKDLHGLDVEDVDNRLQKLEKHVFVDEGGLPAELISLKNRVDNFKMKLEVTFLLYWLKIYVSSANFFCVCVCECVCIT